MFVENTVCNTVTLLIIIRGGETWRVLKQNIATKMTKLKALSAGEISEQLTVGTKWAR